MEVSYQRLTLDNNQEEKLCIVGRQVSDASAETFAKLMLQNDPIVTSVQISGNIL
jgi:hypothetical protein